ncbi:serine/threonine-protein kinase-like protein At3g51990 [Punica granatum]|uniref:Serine/threonine-protein kinase-like protein At3g51990 n=1 Tax=Punica granatum TaxID=22663 RepID=A0A218X0G6_PUNGR|nr:serine/threonine-protein kinase-like protein At3g51990 [Punica granatum]OWM78413.1 hypothetical protein CDL15_Pgr016137 [Punica granatum]
MGYLSCKAQSSISVSNSHAPSPSSSSSKNIKIQYYDYSDLEAATDGFSEQKLLGKGSHGYVYKAFLKGQHVAIKKPSRGLELATEVDNEIEILSKIQSPRLVNLVGFSNDSKSRILVVEFMSNGTLYDILHSNTRSLNWGRRIRLALQIAKAIDTLHSQSPPIIHRDIKSANVLIDRNFNARLGDFGLALRCHANDGRFLSTPPAGTMGYLDPLYVTPDNLSTKTDVFSFGILLLEIISGRKAIDVGYSPPSIVDWAIPLIRKGKLLCVYDPRIAPPKDPVVRKQLAVIAAKCVRSCRERRPAMKEIVNWLTGLSKLVPLHSWNGFNNPCLMVETMGQPVGLRNAHLNAQAESAGGNCDDFEGQLGRAAVRKSRRVYSDLGFRSDLMDLMAVNTDEDLEVRGEANGDDSSNAKVSNRAFSSRFRSTRYLLNERTRQQQPLPYLDNGVAINVRQNRSVGSNSRDVDRSSSSSQRAEDV